MPAFKLESVEMQIKMIFNRFISDTRGSNAVEAAMCFPIIILVLFACYEYSIFFSNSAEVNHVFDDITRQVILLENPTVSEIENVLETSYADGGVSYSVDIIEKYQQKFANITVNYSHTVFLPFAREYALQTQYQNLVMLTTEFE